LPGLRSTQIRQACGLPQAPKFYIRSLQATANVPTRSGQTAQRAIGKPELSEVAQRIVEIFAAGSTAACRSKGFHVRRFVERKGRPA